MRRAAGLSHSPSRIDPETEPDVASLIKVTAAAGMLADVWTRPDVASSTARAKVRVLGLFPLSEAALETLLSRIAGAILEVGPLFDVEMGEPDAIAGVVEQAKETLVMLNLRSAGHRTRRRGRRSHRPLAAIRGRLDAGEVGGWAGT
jgi:hypothetical protein